MDLSASEERIPDENMMFFFYLWIFFCLGVLDEVCKEIKGGND